MHRSLQMVGFYVEETDDGPKIVVVQPYAHADGTIEEIEHETDGPEALWQAFVAMIEDPGGAPTTEPAPGFQRNGDVDHGSSASDELIRAGCDHAEDLVGSALGPFAGRIAGTLLRNPAHAKALGKRLAGAVKSISRGQREPRGSNRW